MLKLFAIFIGGGLGSILRYLTNLLFKNSIFGTFAVNIIGSFILGFLFFYLEEKIQIPKEMKLLITVGFCGGFTTFSTFSLENFSLIFEGEILKSFIYILASVIISISAVYLGVNFAKQF